MNAYRSLREHFERAAMKREAESSFAEGEWRDYRLIRDAHDRRVAEAKDRYRLEYDERVGAARKALIDEAATRPKTLQHPWFRQDRFNTDRIDRLAHRRVQDDHAREIAALGRQCDAELAPLYDRASERLKARDMPQAEFAHRQAQPAGPTRKTRKGPD